MSIRAQRLSICGHRCELCGDYKQALEMHHVFGGNGRRRQCECVETVRMLCLDCHRKIHNCPEIALKIRAEICKELIELYGESKARKMVGGKLYFMEV